MGDIRLVTLFADAMAERLEANAHKHGWEDMSPKQLLRRLEQEVGELRRAIENGESPSRVTHEAADAGNFAAMLSVAYEEQGYGRDQARGIE